MMKIVLSGYFVLVAALIATPIEAQEIDYKLDPQYQLGAVKWQIPFGGYISSSDNGKEVLVVHPDDSLFYLLEIETGHFRNLSLRLKSSDTGATSRGAHSNDLAWMLITYLDTDSTLIWDIAEDRLVRAFPRGESTWPEAISKRLDRLFTDGELRVASTGQVVAVLGDQFSAWFDEAHGMLYRWDNKGSIQEIRASDGKVTNRWTVERGIVRRPPESDWLYCFEYSHNHDFGVRVFAINTVTDSVMIFAGYHPSGQKGQPYHSSRSQYQVSGANAYMMRSDSHPHVSPIWQFNADQSECAVLMDPHFTTNNRRYAPMFYLSTEKNLLLASRIGSTQSDTMTCYEIVPIGTSVKDPDQEQILRLDVWFSAERGVVVHSATEVDAECYLATIDGKVVARKQVAVAAGSESAIAVPDLVPGLYLLSVNWADGSYSKRLLIQ